MTKVAILDKHTSPLPEPTRPGRVFAVSLKGIPPVTTATRARLEAAARSPDSKRHDYPRLLTD